MSSPRSRPQPELLLAVTVTSELLPDQGTGLRMITLSARSKTISVLSGDQKGS